MKLNVLKFILILFFNFLFFYQTQHFIKKINIFIKFTNNLKVIFQHSFTLLLKTGVSFTASLHKTFLQH